jgi:Domain of unknown function (DUF1707)
VTAWPGDQAAGRGYLRASDADREAVVDALKTAFVQGLLTKDELGVRAGQALASRTCGELASIMAGIPVRPPMTRQPPMAAARSARARDRRPVPVKKLVAWGSCGILMPLIGAAFLTYYGGFLVLMVLTFVASVVTAGPVRAGGRRRW